MEPFPQRRYGAILVDPPWRFRTWSETNQNKSASRYYDLLTLDEIKALPVVGLAAPDCALFMWVTNPMLPQAFEVMAAWGFKYKTVAFCWAKTTPKSTPARQKWHMGLGYWTRANVELCLLGTRGKPLRGARDVRQLQIASRRQHSRKPDAIFREIERLVPGGPYVELFARQQSSPNWDYWGNQTNKFDTFAGSLLPA